MNKIKELFVKYKEIILYLIFGGLTTVVSIASFWIFDRIFGVELVMLSNTLSWVFAVAFAYVVNKLFVFESKSWKGNVIAKELVSFIGARLFSLGVESAGMALFIYVLRFDKIGFEIFGIVITGQLIAKTILQVVVVIMNYFFSKFVIFRTKKNDDKHQDSATETEEEIK